MHEVVANAQDDPVWLRNALMVTAPAIVADYSDAAAVLALEWYSEIRAESPVNTSFDPSPLKTVTDVDARAAVARAFDVDAEVARAVANLDGELEMLVADGFRETVVGNTREDPDAVGWKRHANPGACKFCLMLAAKGAVYTEDTARFATHPNCYCIAGPAIGHKEIWAEATPMQYLASERVRTPEEKKNLRAYLKKNYPDAPG